jgi:hypothetical protein
VCQEGAQFPGVKIRGQPPSNGHKYAGTITGETGYLKAAVFCNGWSYSLVDIGRRFGGAYCVHHAFENVELDIGAGRTRQ